MNRREFFNLARKVGIVSAATMVPWKLLESVGAVEEWYQEQAHAAALPQNYLLANGTPVVDTASGIAGIETSAVQSGDGVWAVSEVTDSSYLWPHAPTAPTKILKIQCTQAPTVTSTFYIQWIVSVIPRDTHNFLFMRRGENMNSTTQAGALFLAETSAFSKYYEWNVANTPSAGYESRWFPQIQLMGSPVSTVGTPVPANVHTRMRARFTATVGVAPTYYLCPIWANTIAKPQVVVTFDDAKTTDYTTAFPYMQDRGLVGSIAVNSGLAEMSVVQMLEMQAAGWSMHNHTTTHANLTTLTAAQMRTELETCRDYLRANGLDSGRSAMILPFGARDTAVDAVVAEYYPNAATVGGETVGFPIWPGFIEPHRIQRISMDVPVTSSTMIGYINSAVARGNSIITMGHNVTTSAISGNTDVVDFKAIMDHVYRLKAVGVISNPNLEELFSMRSAPRKRRIA